MSLKFPISLVGKRGGGDISFSHVDSYNSTANTSNYIFNSCNLGEPHADRQIIITLATRSYGAMGISQVKVDGVPLAADQPALGGTGNNTYVAVYRGVIPTGATGDVQVLTSNTPPQNMNISIYRAVSPSLVVEELISSFDESGNVRSFNISAVAGGGIIGVAAHRPDSGSSPLHSWTTGLDTDESRNNENIVFVSSASVVPAETNESFLVQVNLGSSFYSPKPICVISYKPS